ncbi:MAG: hypothetical protein DRI46_08425 [Chloroflexi bacterium]|nr:MAG: hypothetical protein DRI46_08425 [Chloroflexota bacterium]
MKYSITGNPSEFGLRAIGWAQGSKGKATRKQAQAWSRAILQEATNTLLFRYNVHLNDMLGRDGLPIVGTENKNEQIEYSEPPAQKKRRVRKPSPKKAMAKRRKAMAGSMARLREQREEGASE